VNQVIKTNSKGFTLIELLVVIAIIGILSTIAMTSLNGARKKAADASFKSSVSSIQAVAVLCCDDSSTLQSATQAQVDTGTYKICASASVAGAYPKGIGIVTVAVAAPYGADGCDGGAFSIAVAKPAGFGGSLTTGGTCTETQCSFT
jgi:prepilin-type N-terminal cleavage/methylation domain-containing protein